jgi:predicted MFS family arabinose efflux permease
VLAALLACGGLLAAARLPASRAPQSGQAQPVSVRLTAGATFVWQQPILRGIILCALFWNAAYAGLGAIFVLFALERIGLDAQATGLAMAAGGIGFFLGALAAPTILARVSPRVVLVGGPAVSLLAAVLIWQAPVAGGLWPVVTAFMLIGFGPMLWLVLQTSLRQLVTPADRLGSVNALIQTAIYGVRPVGALVAGFVATVAGLDAAVLLVALGFAASLAAAALSALGRLTLMPARLA